MNETLLNKIIHGDCLEEMKNIENKSIDMILCDLPYGTTKNKWDSVIPFELLWEQYNRIIKDNGAIVLFAQSPFDKVLGASNIKYYRYEWIWQKNTPTGFLNAKKMPLKEHENILVFYKKLPTYNPQGTEFYGKTTKRGSFGSNYNEMKPNEKENYQERTNYPRSVLQYSTDKEKLHPTQKPVDLLEYLIKTYSNKEETVLDNCIGSGTAAVAAINTGRNFIGIEKEWEYCEVANQRIEEAKLIKQNN